MNIKEIIDAERWQLKIPVSKIHNASLDRIEDRLVNRVLELQNNFWKTVEKKDERIAELETAKDNYKQMVVEQKQRIAELEKEAGAAYKQGYDDGHSKGFMEGYNEKDQELK